MKRVVVTGIGAITPGNNVEAYEEYQKGLSGANLITCSMQACSKQSLHAK